MTCVAESVTSLTAHIQDGQWGTIAPHTLLVEDSRSSRLGTIPLVDPEITINIVLVINSAARDAAAVRAFASTAASLKLRDSLRFAPVPPK